MAIPKQVADQIKEVEEIEKQMQAQAKGEVEEENPEGTDTVAEDTTQPESVEPAEVEPKEPIAQTVPDDFEQKYSTLRGKYDAEVPRLHSQVKDLTKQIDQLTQRLDAKPSEPVQEQEPVSLVTDADREAFGEDLLDVQRRVAEEVSAKYEKRMAAQMAQIDELKKLIADTGSQIGEMSFDQRLKAAVPDFDTLNIDKRWVNWLDEVDPMLRGPRRLAAQRAFAEGDVDAVVHYVNLYKSSVQTPEPVNKNQAELEKQVTPTRSATSSSQPSSNGKKLYSAQDADRAWAKVRELNSTQKYDEATKLEAEITAAYMEGRVRS